MTNEEPLDIGAELKKAEECQWAADPKTLLQALTELQAARKEIGDLTRTICEEVQESVAKAERIAELEAAVKDYQEGKFL